MGKADQKIILERYQVYPRTLCFVTHGNDVLLLHGAPDKRIWPNRCNGVGGHIEPGEDVYNAAMREIVEETGLPTRCLQLRGIVHVTLPERQPGIMLFVFTAEALHRSFVPSPEGSLEWVPRDHLLEYDLVEDLPVLLPRILTSAQDAPPFFAHYTYDNTDRLQITFADAAAAAASAC
ncbi:MAG: NUDIX domain-containing protein [Anaerolineales bacterium]|nr:NUDIX domain-containing protein [Anaerolineales bacterium]